ncbi:hypothetical protein [Paenibacillus arenosi]|uniref:Leucine-rich repeat domain-containing protein n=1 Tax=Paenibacillus arenosi TaxID=2774142 RepID=A0ABR9B3M9_9BACL|nr:hypothetical protein [Paenibacillus arenosi]MBD8500950.1 hypothetical protein [Paenibacillus arenosi]
MRKKWKRKILINNPDALDRVQIKQDLRAGNQVIVQFSHPDFYGSILEEVDELCARFDENFGVRFYGHNSLSFDARTLLKIPHVKNLHLNSLIHAHNIETLSALKHIHSLHVGIHELENSDILGIDSLRSLRDLSIISDKKLLNLQYVKEFSHLEHLHVGGKVKNLEALGYLEGLNYLALHSISKLPLHFINRLKKLKHLRILLGGREHIQEIEENEIDHLEICRIRGFHDLSNITRFRALTSLTIEDQAQMREISFDRGMETLEEMTISNCKGLSFLSDMERLPSLRKLRIFKTAIDFDSFIQQKLPRALSELEFTTSKSKVDLEIQDSLFKLGFQRWSI